MRILLVEDDPQLGDGLTVGLRQLDYAVDWVKDGISADAALATDTYGVMILDLGLPRMSGMDLLAKIRDRGLDLPVLILTARDGLADKIAGFDSGADDFLVKPVALEELVARIRAIARRAAGRALPIIRHGRLTLDPASHSVHLDDQPVDLSAREFAVLQTLLENAGRVLTRGQIESTIYDWRDEPESNVLEVHIHYLRKKLGSDLIKTLRGVGYTIAKP
jgi:two-component system OmpR family response regulator/two-component system response regulator QseB